MEHATSSRVRDLEKQLDAERKRAEVGRVHFNMGAGVMQLGTNARV